MKIVLMLAAAAVALASTASSPSLMSTEPWWERITVTMAGDGEEQACVYETSTSSRPEKCDTEQATAGAEASASGPNGLRTKVTFERRFSPGREPDIGKLHAGDTLLGGQVMALAIDSTGSVRGCEVVAVSGEAPEYSCPQARAERFTVSAPRKAEPVRQGFMTILVYGHSEQVV